MLWKCCIQYASKYGKFSSGHRTGKVSFFPTPKKGNAKEHSNYNTISVISHSSEVMLEILQAGLQQHANWKLTDVQAGFQKGRGNRSNCQHMLSHMKSKRIPEKKKNIYFCFTDYPGVFDCVDHSKLENSLRDGNTRAPYLPPEKLIHCSRSNS